MPALEPRSTKIESGILILELESPKLGLGSTKATTKFTKAMLESIVARFGALGCVWETFWEKLLRKCKAL